MSKKLTAILAASALAVAGTAIATQSAAHHSFAAEFDVKKPVEVSGVITKARIVNPHGWLYLDVKNKDGSVTNWGFEFGTPLLIKTKGITKEEIKVGTPVHIEGFRAKNTGPFGYAQTVKFGSGREVQIGSAPDAPKIRAGR